MDGPSGMKAQFHESKVINDTLQFISQPNSVYGLQKIMNQWQ